MRRWGSRSSSGRRRRIACDPVRKDSVQEREEHEQDHLRNGPRGHGVQPGRGAAGAADPAELGASLDAPRRAREGQRARAGLLRDVQCDLRDAPRRAVQVRLVRASADARFGRQAPGRHLLLERQALHGGVHPEGRAEARAHRRVGREPEEDRHDRVRALRRRHRVHGRRAVRGPRPGAQPGQAVPRQLFRQVRRRDAPAALRAVPRRPRLRRDRRRPEHRDGRREALHQLLHAGRGLSLLLRVRQGLQRAAVARLWMASRPRPRRRRRAGPDRCRRSRRGARSCNGRSGWRGDARSRRIRRARRRVFSWGAI